MHKYIIGSSLVIGLVACQPQSEVKPKTETNVAVPAHVTAPMNWVLDGAASHISYGSIKKNKIGEVNRFSGVSGMVNKAGDVVLKLDLTSLETNIDIRNERMQDHVFNNVPDVTMTGKINVAQLSQMTVGAATVLESEINLDFLGKTIPVETELYVLRLSNERVMVSTNDMVFLGVEDAGLTVGVDKLQQLAKLDSITRTVPVTMRLFFNIDTDQTVSMAAPVPVSVKASAPVQTAANTLNTPYAACLLYTSDAADD